MTVLRKKKYTQRKIPYHASYCAFSPAWDEMQQNQRNKTRDIYHRYLHHVWVVCCRHQHVHVPECLEKIREIAVSVRVSESSAKTKDDASQDERCFFSVVAMGHVPFSFTIEAPMLTYSGITSWPSRQTRPCCTQTTPRRERHQEASAWCS